MEVVVVVEVVDELVVWEVEELEVVLAAVVVVVTVVVELDELVQDAPEHPDVVVVPAPVVVVPPSPFKKNAVTATEVQRMPMMAATARVLRVGIPFPFLSRGIIALTPFLD